MNARLSFEQAPPISVPFRFFLTAPLFAAAAGLLLAAEGAAIFDSRWQGSTLALTHLVTLGFMMTSMCGAMLQLLPVAAGANVARPRLTAWVTHSGLVAGTLLLVAGFLGAPPLAFRLAAPLLGTALGAFAVVVLAGLVRSPAVGPTIRALRLAIPGLAAAVALGLVLTVAFGWPLAIDLPAFTSAHAVWALLGWSLLLLSAVAYLVVPMFQLTPAYPGRYSRAWPPALFALCALWTFAELDLLPVRPVAGLALVAGAAGFALVTLRLQHRRRRRIADTTLLYWRTAMLALLAAALAGALRLGLEPGAFAARAELLLGVLIIGGTFMAAISGMLGKIVPFICWLHLQRVLKAPPNMNELLPERRARGQFRLWLAAFAMLVAAVAWPVLVRPAGLLLVAASLWLELELLRATTMYWRLRRSAGSGAAADLRADARATSAGPGPRSDGPAR